MLRSRKSLALHTGSVCDNKSGDKGMGTYLHPRTEDPRKLERLAGVSSGVYERLAEQEKAVKAVTDALMSEFQCSVWEVDRHCYNAGFDDPHFAMYQWRAKHDAEAADLSDFLIFGWGKDGHRALPEYVFSLPGNSIGLGRITDPATVRSLGYSPEETEGLTWS